MKIHKSIIGTGAVFIENDGDTTPQVIDVPVVYMTKESNDEESLPVPCLSFETTSVSCESGSGLPGRQEAEPASFPRHAPESQVLNVPAANGAAELLLMPTMNFAKPGKQR